MRIATLWTYETDYFWSAIRRGGARGHEMFVATLGADPHSPHVTGQGVPVDYAAGESERELLARLETFNPDVLVVAGWHIPHFVAATKAWRDRCARVLLLDNQWRATPKQRLGQLAFRSTLRHAYDAALVPGPRQELFVRHMGFRPENIHLGSIPCNYELFEHPATNYGRYFLTASRLVEVKGIDTLLAAYAGYRRADQAPWDLVVAGTGPFPVPESDGVKPVGFTTPAALSALAGGAGAFVLASTFEPWAVVLHEAAAASRPIVATRECGAVGTFVIDGVNGFVVSPSSVDELSDALTRVASLGDDGLARLGRRSGLLAQRSTPDTWVDAVENIAYRWHRAHRRSA